MLAEQIIVYYAHDSKAGMTFDFNIIISPYAECHKFFFY